MRKLVALIVLAGMSNGAAAYWMKIRDAGALLEYNFYAEPATIVKVRDIARIQTLNDYKTMQARASGYRYLSLTALNECNCKTRQLRITSTVLYERNMATGFSIDTLMEALPWIAVVPGSSDEAVWKLACGNL